MNIFISYSTDDTTLIKKIASEIGRFENVYYWEQNKKPGKRVWQQIFKWIDESDIVLVVVTDNTVSNAMSVGQEIGRAITKNKLIIPLVSPSIDQNRLGCLQGIVYQPLDESKIDNVINNILKEILTIRKENEQPSWLESTIVIAGLVLLVKWANRD